MPCFYTEDVLFVMNKWDRVPTDERLNIKQNASKCIMDAWPDVGMTPENAFYVSLKQVCLFLMLSY